MADLLTWSSDLDNAADDISTVANVGKALAFQLWRALLGAGGVCEGSSDGVTQGMDGVDRLSNGGAFNAALWVRGATSGAHTWGVIGFLGHHLLLDLSGGADYYPLVVSAARTPYALAGGAYVPASADSVQQGMSATQAALCDNTATAHRLNLIYATRGDFWAWVVNSAGKEIWALGLTQVDDIDADAGDNYPVVGYCYGATIGNALGQTIVMMTPGGATPWFGRTGGGSLAQTNLTASGPVSSGGTSLLQYLPNGIDQWRKKYLSVPIYLWVRDTASSYPFGSYKGVIPDLSFAPQGLPSGTPNTQPPTRRVIGQLWLPGMPTIPPTY